MDNDAKLLEKLGESIREALSASFTASEMLRDRLPEGNTDIDESLAIVRHGQYRLRLIAEQLGDIASMRSDSGRPDLARIDVVRLCADLADSVSFFVSFSGVSVRFECGSESMNVILDPVRIERMLMELLSNAVRHTHEGRSVRFSLTVTDDDLVFRITDTGRGLGENKLFAPYPDSDPVQPEIVPGLGLSSAEYIAKLHGGRLDIETSPDGSSVTVTIPADRTPLLRLDSPFESYYTCAESRLLTGLSSVLTYKFYMSPYL